MAIQKGQTYQKTFHESERNLADYIYLIGKNNFPDRIPFNAKTVMEWVLPVILRVRLWVSAGKRLDDMNVLHQTVIPEHAKWVLCKKSKDTKNIKDGRQIIKNAIVKYCGAICIDEVQDIDKHMQEIIEELSGMEIPMILMGDPKQDLKGFKCLRNLMLQIVKLLIFCIRNCTCFNDRSRALFLIFNCRLSMQPK